ncbi:hypothetical protein Rs2_44525 [Raphanus sativus]|nr:hypothetical protein Rs2_44525 [Raphanus sativus]
MIGPPFGSLFQVETEKRHLASRLLTLLGVPHIATGDLVHEELASLGPFSRQLSEIVNQGKLVSDEIIVNLLSKRLEAGEAKGESGFILYGFPRTMRQAEMLGDVTDISLVVNLKLPEEVLVDKCLGRRMQQRLRIYNETSQPLEELVLFKPFLLLGLVHDQQAKRFPYKITSCESDI